MSVVSLVLYLLFKFEEKRVFKKKNKLNNYPLTAFVLYFSGKYEIHFIVQQIKQTNKQKIQEL